MKIAIYYPWIHLKSGVEKTILETIKNSKHDFTVFTNYFDLKNTYPEFRNIKVVELKRVPIKRSLRSAFMAAAIIFFQKIDLKQFKALIVHSEGMGDLILVRNSNQQTYNYCHTPLRPVFDTEYKKRAFAKRGLLQKILFIIFEHTFKIVDRLLWKRYKHIFFNSNESLSRAETGGLLVGFNKFEILHPGVDTSSIKPTGIYNKYFLVAGRIMWTKNIELAIDGFAEFVKQNTNNKKFKMVICGQVDKKSLPYLNSLKKRAKGLNIKFVPNPSLKVFSDYYKNCYCVVATSFNEDWGIVPIEANAYGKAVIATNFGGFKESQKDGITGFLVDLDKFQVAKKMSILANDINLVKKMGDKARLNSEEYDWKKFTNRIDQMLNLI